MKATGYFAELQREVRKKKETETQKLEVKPEAERENGKEHLDSGKWNKKEWMGPEEDKEGPHWQRSPLYAFLP